MEKEMPVVTLLREFRDILESLESRDMLDNRGSSGLCDWSSTDSHGSSRSHDML